MGGFRSSKAIAIIASASVLLYQTASAHSVSQHKHLRHRNLQTDDDTDNSRDFDHLGCFKDSEDDRLLGEKMVDREKQTPDFCYDYCVNLGATLMGTQYGIECWCHTEEEEADFGRHGEGAECNYPCADDEEEMCGGFYAIDLYLIGSDRTEAGSENAPPDGALVDDIVKIVPVNGADPLGVSWADSYSVGGRCYMHTTFDHDIGGFMVDTPKGGMTIRELFNNLQAGPGADGHPLYNDIQCGNGPANTAPDETDCPGLVEYGPNGCGQIGPMWELSELE